MKISCNITTLVSVSLLLLLYSISISAQEVEDEGEFEYNERSNKGPKFWGDLKQEWGACKGGGDKMQSPIDITKQTVESIANSGDLITNYKPFDATFKNRGHDISLVWLGDAGSIKINGTDYILKQCHWHSPSEHSIDGRRYDMELHMVHSTPDNKAAVIGLLYNIGQPDPFLSKRSTEIASMGNDNERHAERKVGIIDPKEIERVGSKYYKYMGSLTTPPCTEGVIWIINEHIATISKEQVRLLRDAVHDYAVENARPIQPFNGRKVQLHHPEEAGSPGRTQ